MKQKATYARIARSKSFRNRAEADKWAKDQKETYRMQGVSARIEINYDDKTGRWNADIFIKADGARSVETPDKP